MPRSEIFEFLGEGFYGLDAKFMSKLLKSFQNVLHLVLFLFPLAIGSMEEFPFLYILDNTYYCLSKIRAIMMDNTARPAVVWFVFPND